MKVEKLALVQEVGFTRVYRRIKKIAALGPRMKAA